MDAVRDTGGGAFREDKGRRKKVGLLQEAIHGLLQEKRGKPHHQQQREGEDASSTIVLRDQEEDLLLSSLLSKLDAVEKDVDLDHDEPNSFHPKSESSKAVGLDDIAKDLHKIKRQNMITHILLGTVIVMTAVWQFNEVSFLLRVQEKLSNPFKYLGDMIKSSLKRDRKATIEASPLPPVGIPDVTRTDLPMLVSGNDDG